MELFTREGDIEFGTDPLPKDSADPAGHVTAWSQNYPVRYSWNDNGRRQINLRTNIDDKLRSKHNLTWRVARATTQWNQGRQHLGGTRYKYETLVNNVRCSGWWIFRKCTVIDSVTVRAVVDMRTDTSDGKRFGVVTTYCPGRGDWCPSFVKNSLNI